MPRILARPFLLMAALAGLVAATPALAQTGADFYKGKTLTYIVATPPGGGYDFWGRLVAEYMQKYLPGSGHNRSNSFPISTVKPSSLSDCDRIRLIAESARNRRRSRSRDA